MSRKRTRDNDESNHVNMLDEICRTATFLDASLCFKMSTDHLLNPKKIQLLDDHLRNFPNLVLVMSGSESLIQ